MAWLRVALRVVCWIVGHVRLDSENGTEACVRCGKQGKAVG